jgi:hypothetical protein
MRNDTGLSYCGTAPEEDTMIGMGTHTRNWRHATPGTRNHHWPLLAIAAPAAVAIWSGWVGLGTMSGFGIVHPLPGIIDSVRIDTAITLPIGVESYGAYALWVWLSGRGSDRTLTFARRSALGALTLGCLGQVIFHLLAAAHWTVAPWPVVVTVACMPVVTLSFAAALVHLTRADIRAEEEAELAAERAKAEREAARAARAELPPRAPSRNRRPGTRPARNRRSAGTAGRKQPESAPEPAAPEPAAEETVGIDAEARILELIAQGRSASEAGVLAGKSDSYGRKVARTAKKLAESAPRGSDAGQETGP